MKQRLIQSFLYSAGVLLLITGLAKLVSATGTAAVLTTSDPILYMPYKNLFWGLGSAEVLIGAVCFTSKHTIVKALFVSLLATNFTVYRVALLVLGYHTCSCLGNLTDKLGIPARMADSVMKIALVYLLVGSYVTLYQLWKDNKRPSPISSQ